MRIWIILAIGMAISLPGRVFGQEELSPLNSAGDEFRGLDLQPQEALTFAPNDDNRWFTADFLFGWMTSAHLPALVTTSEPPPATKLDAGVLGKAGTLTLLSGSVNGDVLPGFRLGGGFLYDRENGMGAEAGFMFLPKQSSTFFFQNGILGRPFLDASDSGKPAAELVAYPGDSTGDISVTSKTGSFYGLNLDLSERIGDDEGQRWEALFGYRFAYFTDALRIRQHSDLTPSLTGITAIDRLDDFASKNVFHGLDLGFRGTFSRDQWSLSLLGKVAPGYMSRTVDIHGRSVTTFASGAKTSVPAGLYALSSNSGSHETGKWTVLPEVGANLNWKLRSNLAMRLGYSALFVTKVNRADDQIDFNINPALIGALAGATPKLPAFHSDQSNLCIQSLNLGLEFTF